ncbi:hypothetical protein GGTG_12011 [Gaeumannomyces tritici R3-111a-1]|uniref:TLC domain-containing protein n=1 Tax=Gaeumannomyces tritici (strain R3-111a-1) TaxID=644352 RepID=J3PET2_GAET3|nr:hypothetical protein GGTG_12011 [Gaeumannomyces tritici R3-111a-1]EJT70990.1 hypothetical protein GGTG_12011 [Gaeumannomyces tritici R3-111a-1]
MSGPHGGGGDTLGPPSPRRSAVRDPSVIRKDTMNGPLYMQASNKTMLVRRVKRRGDGPLKNFTRWCVDNQIGLSLNLLALLALTHFFFPKSREYTSKFFSSSHYNPKTEKYTIGNDDGYQLLFWVVAFTGIRASVMEYALAPFAKWHGLKKRKTVTRFSEQGWLIAYYAVFWPLGMYIYLNSEYYMNMRNLWTAWPSREVDGLMKGYMLAQLAFWMQQILVINIEERRKDHWQMFAHHIITVTLIYSSWRYGYTRVGNLILILMDGVDIVFSSAKCLKYLGYNRACDVFFGLFMVSWVLARHVAYLMVCYSVYRDASIEMGGQCWRDTPRGRDGPLPKPNGFIYMVEPLWDPEAIVCFDQSVKWGFLSVLLMLQGITLVWLMAIFRVAVKVIRGTGAEDTRSDDEEETEEQDQNEYADDRTRANAVEAAIANHGGKVSRNDEAENDDDQPIEEEVGVEDIDLKGWGRRSGVKRQASSSTGVSLPGHSDRKELLGRIGCEKHVD